MRCFFYQFSFWWIFFGFSFSFSFFHFFGYRLVPFDVIRLLFLCHVSHFCCCILLLIESHHEVYTCWPLNIKISATWCSMPCTANIKVWLNRDEPTFSVTTMKSRHRCRWRKSTVSSVSISIFRVFAIWKHQICESWLMKWRHVILCRRVILVFQCIGCGTTPFSPSLCRASLIYIKACHSRHQINSNPLSFSLLLFIGVFV